MLGESLIGVVATESFVGAFELGSIALMSLCSRLGSALRPPGKLKTQETRPPPFLLVEAGLLMRLDLLRVPLVAELRQDY